MNGAVSPATSSALVEARRADSPAPSLSRTTVRHVALLFGPAAVCILIMRLLEHSLLSAIGMPPVADVLHDAGLLPGSVLLSIAALGLVGRMARPALSARWLLPSLVLLSAGALVLAGLLAPPWQRAWMTPRAFQVIRWDALFLLILGIGALLALDRLRGTARRLCLTLLHLLVPLLMLVPMIELSAIMALGSPPDASLMLYTMTRLHELAPVLGSEISLGQGMLLALVPVLTLTPLLILRLRPYPADEAPTSLSFPWPPLVAALPVAALLTLPPSTPLPPTHHTISYAGIARSLFNDAIFEPDNLDELAAAAKPPFDSRALTLAPTERQRPLNVVVILLESVRRQSVTPYDSSVTTTPFLDKLAARSLLIEQMYAVVSYTNKSLAPIFAGIYPELSLDVVEARRLPARGLPALLKPHGYRSAFFTPAKLSFERKDLILKNLGFEEVSGDGDYPTTGFHPTNYFGYEDRIVIEPSLAWIDEAVASGQPFFLSYLTLTTHHEYTVPPTFPEQPFALHDEKLNDYLNAIHYTDTVLAELFAAFEARGLFDNTLFVILGDHGEAFGEHGQYVHGDIVWDEALGVPGLLFCPALFPEGRRLPGHSSHLDVMPTIVDALGFEMENGYVPGRSLLQPVPTDRILYHSARNGNQVLAMRQDSLKFFYYNRRQPMQVFDVRNDPLEHIDIADQLPDAVLQEAELNLLLWRKSMQEMYH